MRLTERETQQERQTFQPLPVVGRDLAASVGAAAAAAGAAAAGAAAAGAAAASCAGVIGFRV
jgi:hypothetical protein